MNTVKMNRPSYEAYVTLYKKENMIKILNEYFVDLNKYVDDLEEKLTSFIDAESGFKKRIEELEGQILLKDNEIIFQKKTYKLLADELIEKEKALYILAGMADCNLLSIDDCNFLTFDNKNCEHEEDCAECKIKFIINEIKKGKIK